jgi:hypothetical protein
MIETIPNNSEFENSKSMPDAVLHDLFWFMKIAELLRWWTFFVKRGNNFKVKYKNQTFETSRVGKLSSSLE